MLLLLLLLMQFCCIGSTNAASATATQVLTGTAHTIMEDHFDTREHFMSHVLTMDNGQSYAITGLPKGTQFPGGQRITVTVDKTALTPSQLRWVAPS
jgi:hypothetical protein